MKNNVQESVEKLFDPKADPDTRKLSLKLLDELTGRDETVFHYLAEAQKRGANLSPLLNIWIGRIQHKKTGSDLRDFWIWRDPSQKLMNAAKHGVDISSAVRTLRNSLIKPAPVNNNSMRALVYHYINKGKWRTLKKLLDEVGTLKFPAIYPIRYAAKKHKDISSVLESVEFILENGDVSDSVAAGEALGYHYIDTGKKEEALSRLNTQNHEVSEHSRKFFLRGLMKALTHRYVESCCWDGIENILGSDDPEKVSQCASAIIEAIEEGKNISPVIPALGHALVNGPDIGSMNVSRTLFIAVEKGIDISSAIPSMLESLKTDNPTAYRCSFDALVKAVELDLVSVEKLKKTMDSVLKKQGSLGTKIKLKREFASLYSRAVYVIGKKDADLADLKTKKFPEKPDKKTFRVRRLTNGN